MKKKITEEDIKILLRRLESFNENTQENEIEELTKIAKFILNMGGLSNTLNLLFNQGQAADTNLINILITSVNAQEMKIIYSSAILRYTCYYKDKLPSWENLLETIYQKCLLEKINVNDILCGLKN